MPHFRWKKYLSIALSIVLAVLLVHPVLGASTRSDSDTNRNEPLTQQRKRTVNDPLNNPINRGALVNVLTNPAAAVISDIDADITPLSPPDTTSPRVTLEEFRSNMDLTYRLIVSAYETGRKDLSPSYSPEEKQKAYQAEEALERAIKTLDLSDVPPAQLEDVGVESALLLKEILDRIPLPPEERIPGIVAVRKEKLTTGRFPIQKLPF